MRQVWHSYGIYRRSLVPPLIICHVFQLLMSDIDDIIAGGGIVFRPMKKDDNTGKVKTKAKKKAYITGAHGSGSARQKSKYRAQRANRKRK